MAVISHSYKQGFTLIEIAVVLAIIATIAGAMLTLSNKQLTQDKYLDTIDKLKTIDDALQRYVILAGELPCPAARNAALDNLAFGVESEAQCNGAASPPETYDVAGGEIRIGTVPVRELNLPDEFMFDAWNMRITYVMVKALGVDGALTSANVTAPPSGGIAIVDRNGNLMIDRTPPLDTTQFVAYALIAHGENRNGAVNRIGTPNTCNAAFGDGDNCDLADAQFRDMRFNNESATNADYFDDIVIWQPAYLINPELR